MKIEGKNVLVTGATGFIGSHLVQRLLDVGANVRALAHYRGDPSLHNLEYLQGSERQRVEVVWGNIKDPFFVQHCVSGCEVVFHLAALIAIPYSYRAPASYVETNIKGTLNVLEACRAEKTARLIHTSTSECYGTARYTPIDEEHPLQGQSPYSATKIGADKLVESYHRSFGLEVVTVRPFNTYGPRQSARAVIPTIILQLLSDAEKLSMGSIGPVRDLTYVTDTADGFIKAACTSGISGQLINLGVGKGISIGKLAEKIMAILGVQLEIETETERLRPQDSEVMQLISNNAKAAQIIGWTPSVSLDEGLARTIDFYRDHLNLFESKEYAI